MANKKKKSEATPPADDFQFIYRIDQEPHDVDAVTLGRTITALGQLIAESAQTLNPGDESLQVSVLPFKDGSFEMNLVFELKQAGQFLFALSQTDAMKQVRATLEMLGLVKKVGGQASNLLSTILKLGGKKPTKIIKRKAGFQYEAEDGTKFPVSEGVNNLYSNSTIINNFYPAVGAPLERAETRAVETYFRGEKGASAVVVSKADADVLRLFSQPNEVVEEKRLINEMTQILRPKSGNYGDDSGLWTFTLAGTKRSLRAKISDPKFLAKYTNGSVRFFQGDQLEVRIRETQILRGNDARVENEIVEVLHYASASTTSSPPALRRQSKKRKT